MLAVVMLINRSGSMVLPFLGLYLSASLHFSVAQTATVLSLFGIGAAIGSLIGGVLSDRIGSFRVQFLSLALGGLGLIGFSFLKTFETLAPTALVLAIVTESLRPANTSSVARYAKPENLTKAYSLNRMAINLGFSIGPAVGGLLAAISYPLLFWFDGLTCLLASLVFFVYFRKRQARSEAPKSPALAGLVKVFRDHRHLLFLGVCGGFAVLFFQLFSSIPLYFREVAGLNEKSIGLLFALNGILVFIVEMPLVAWLSRTWGGRKSIAAGFLTLGLSFLCFYAGHTYGWMLAGILVLSVAEMLALPFTVSLAARFAPDALRGSYMGMFALSFALSHSIAPALGLGIVEQLGFAWLWPILTFLCLPPVFALLLGRERETPMESTPI
ncbi:MFS transporter [bacterium]|nr:MFS transporter [bacterium]